MGRLLLLLLLIGAIAGVSVILYQRTFSSTSAVSFQQHATTKIEQAFAQDSFRTNTTKHSIPLDQILNGGPGKDGIPALINPAFASIQEAGQYLTDGSGGMTVQ